MHISELVTYLDGLLDAKDFSDASYNGLQVAGTSEIKRIATACTASLEAIDAAIEAKADALIVHHGLFWKGADPRIIGNYHLRIKSLIENNINLLAYHLPLDAHLEFGNNAYLAHILGGDIVDYIEPGEKRSIGIRASLAEPLSVREIISLLCTRLDTKVSLLGNITDEVMLDELAICSGSGSSLLDNNKCPSFQALITGDVNEQTLHMAKETGTIVFVVGHHASEQEPVNLLGEHLAKQFKLKHNPTHFSYEKDLLTFTQESVAEDEDDSEFSAD